VAGLRQRAGGPQNLQIALLNLLGQRNRIRNREGGEKNHPTFTYKNEAFIGNINYI
jgi:hypothetical protein